MKPCFPAQVKQADFEARVTADDAKFLWDYAKAQPYFAQGYDALVDGLRADIKAQHGIDYPREWLVKTLDRNKTVRNATNQMLIAQMNRQNILARARMEARFIDSNRLTQAGLMLNDGIRGMYTLYHGPVFAWTHAQSLAELVAVDPVKIAYGMARGKSFEEMASKSGNFARMAIKSWQHFLQPNEYANTVKWMEAHPRYMEWVKAGNDIKMGRPPMGIFAGKELKPSMRAWEGLKPIRLTMADAEMYAGDPRDPHAMTLKPEFQGLTPEELHRVRQQISSNINHITGTVSPGEWSLKGGAWFAPALTASKWHGLVGDMGKSLAIMSKGTGNITAAERSKVSLTMRTVGGLFAAHTGWLALNEAMLKLQKQLGGPDQHVNWKEYGKGDWLSFKIGGYTIKPRGLVEPVQLMGKIAGLVTGGGRKVGTTGTPSSIGEIGGRYAEYKLSPGTSLGVEVATGRDIFGRPVPWGRTITGAPVRETHREPRYTYPEYALTHGPIFWNEAVHEFYAGLRDHGIDAGSATAIMRGISRNPQIVRDAAVQGAAGFVGLGMHRDYDLKKKQP